MDPPPADVELLGEDAAPAVEGGATLADVALLEEDAPTFLADALFAAGQRNYVKGEQLRFAARCFRAAADRGHVDAHRYLGSMFWRGDGVAKDETRAVAWLQRAADAGDARAQNNLGTCYDYGGDVIVQDCEKAVRWYTLAAAQGEATAQRNLATCYRDCRGVARDLAAAARYFRLAAAQGDERARTRLADM